MGPPTLPFAMFSTQSSQLTTGISIVPKVYSPKSVFASSSVSPDTSLVIVPTKMPPTI